MAQNWLSKAVPVQPEQENKPSTSSWLDKARMVDGSPMPAWAAKAKQISPAEESEPVKPSGFEGTLSDSDIQKIADKYKVSPEELKSIAPYYGAMPQPESIAGSLPTAAKYAAGVVGRTAGLSIPQFVYKKLQSDPNMRAAIDELTSIGEEQKTPLETATELVMPAGVGSVASKAAGRIAQGALMGGAIGLGTSKEGQEGKGALMGAGVGLGLGVGAETVGAALPRLFKSKTEKALLETPVSQQAQVDINKATDDVAKVTAPGETLLEDVVMRGKPTLSEKEVDTVLTSEFGESGIAKLLDTDTAEGNLIRKKYGLPEDRPLTPELKKRVVDDLVESRAIEFAQQLSGTKPDTAEKALSVIEQVASRQGKEAVEDTYRKFISLKNTEKAVEELGLRSTREQSAVSEAINKFSDNQFVLRGTDEKYGVRAEQALSDASSAYARQTGASNIFKKMQEEVFQSASKAGGAIDRDLASRGGEIYRALDSGGVTQLQGQSRLVAEEVQQYFKKIREFVNGKVRERDPGIMPLSIPEIKNYIPKLLPDTPEVISRLGAKIEEATKGAGVDSLAALRGSEYIKAVSGGPVKDLVDAVSLFIPKPIHSGAELSAALKRLMYSREGRMSVETSARSALERTGAIPDFLLEKNVYKLMNKYTNNTLRHLYLRKPLEQLRLEAEKLSRIGAESEAMYIKNIISDALGVRKGSFAEYGMQASTTLQSALDARIRAAGGPDTLKGASLTVMKAVPTILHDMLQQIYPNVLGWWNIRAAIQNSTQTLTKTLPELGLVYGPGATIKGAVHTVGNFKRLIQKAKDMGTLPDEFIHAGQQAISDGILRTSLYRMPKKAVDAAGKVGMVLFSRIEEMNRAMVLGIGEVMGRDLARGDAKALSSLRKLPAFVQERVQANPGKAGDIIGKYLNDSTMYNYNKLNMSEFGRTWGPLISTFSKWPTATAGEIVQEMRSKGVLKGTGRNLEKFLAPLILLQSIDILLGEQNALTDKLGLDQPGFSDRQKKLLGSSGLSQSAPIGAASAILKGEIFTPPVVDAIAQSVVSPLLEGKTPDPVKGVETAVTNFMPGAGLFRFLFDDMVTYIDGERPEGKGQFEKNIEGMRRVNTK